MNENIRNELILMMSINEKVKGNDQIKIISELTCILSNDKYLDDLKKELNPVVESDYNYSDFPHLIKNVIEINKKYDFYKAISEGHMLYVLWGIIFNYFLKFGSDKLNDLSQTRMLYLNTMDLILMVPETIKIQKVNCASCLGRFLPSYLGFLDKKTKI